MHEHRPSLTAACVSFGRGIGKPGLGSDPYAVELCPFPFRPLLKAQAKADATSGVLAEPLRGLLRVASLGMIDHVSLRTSAIDRGLGGALAAGAQQVVLLGAGLDARGWRLPALAGRRVFEVDHPATQRYKRVRMGEHEDLAYVAVDFERDDLGERLLGAGFDPGRPSVWIWEGVTMYLPEAAIRQSLATVAQLSAPGSRLLITYMLEGGVPGGPLTARAIRAVFERVGEGLRAGFKRSAMRALLEEHGFSLLTDTDGVDWAEAAEVPSLGALSFRSERLAIAQRV